MSDKLTQAVLGFRQWRLTNNGLMPQFYDRPWEAGVNIAECDNGCKAPASEKCSCGLYAWHTLSELATHYEGEDEYNIHGAVAGWGRVTVHQKGWRAEKARILALAVEVESPISQAVAGALSTSIGVPVVPFDMLQLEGARHAGAVPNEMIPEPPAPKQKKSAGWLTFYDQALKDVWTNDRFYFSSASIPLKTSSIVDTYSPGDLLAELKKLQND